jgi:phage FluMu gp28-like protein
MLSEELWKLLTLKNLYPYQKSLLQETSDRIIINKSRQTGISSFYAFYALTKAIYGKKTLIVSPSEKQSINFLNYAKEYYVKYLTQTNKDLTDRFTHQELELRNGGKILSLPNSSKTIRGFVGDLIIFDEMAHIENARELFDAVYPMITRGGSCIMISTPLGEGNLFSEYWREYERYGFKKHLINWKECPDFSQEKMDKLKLSMDEISWRQEYENEFLGTLESYFTMDLIYKVIDKNIICTDVPEQIHERLTFGVDIGRHADKTAIAGVNENGDVKFLKTMKNIPYREQMAFIETLVPKAHQIRIDQNGIGNQLSEELSGKHSEIKGITITHNYKTEGFINLRKMMEQKLIHLPDNFELKRALNLIERKQAGTNITFDAPRTDETGHSDLSFALMMSIHDDGGGVYVPDVGF